MLLNIQALRAWAAALVVMVHLAAIMAAAGWSTTPALIGHCGVDLFFVLSGYLMVYSTAMKPVSAGGFLVNRIIRVAPLYWLCTGLVAAVGLLRPALLGATQVTGANLVRSLLFVPYARPNGLTEPLLFLGWTLNYEMAFYALFAASLLIARGRGRWRGLWAAPVIVALVGAGRLIGPTSVAGRFYTNPIMLEFAFGMVLAALLGRDRAVSRRVAWLLTLGGAALLIGRFLVVPGGERAWWSGLPAAAILAGIVSLERHGTAWRGRGVQLLGAASYALYLVHPFVTQALVKLMVARFGGQPALLGLGIPVIFAAVAAAAIVVHRLVERPMTDALRRLAGHPPSAVEREERRIDGRRGAADPLAAPWLAERGTAGERA